MNKSTTEPVVSDEEVKAMLIDSLTKARDTLSDLILPLRMWQRGLAADGCQIAVNAINETLDAATKGREQH